MKFIKPSFKIIGVIALTLLFAFARDVYFALKDERVNREYYEWLPIRYATGPCGKADNTGMIKIAGKPAIYIHEPDYPIYKGGKNPNGEYIFRNDNVIADYTAWQNIQLAEMSQRGNNTQSAFAGQRR